MTELTQENYFDILKDDPKLLSEYLHGLGPADRKRVFDDIRRRIYEGAGQGKNIPLPTELLNANLNNLAFAEHEYHPLTLGSIPFEGQEVYIEQGMERIGKIGSLTYNLKSETPSRFTGNTIIINHLSVMTWHWVDEEQAINSHREVLVPSYRSKGLGEAMLRLSEDALKKLGFKQAIIETKKPASASWFFKQNFEPLASSDLNPEILKGILRQETDYTIQAGDKIRMAKDLQA